MPFKNYQPDKYKDIPKDFVKYPYKFYDNKYDILNEEGKVLFTGTNTCEIIDDFVLAPNGNYMKRRSYRNNLVCRNKRFEVFMEGVKTNKDIPSKDGKIIYKKGTRLFEMFQEKFSTTFCPECGIEYNYYDFLHRYSLYHNALIFKQNQKKEVKPVEVKPIKTEEVLNGKLYEVLSYEQPKRYAINDERFIKVKKTLLLGNWQPYCILYGEHPYFEAHIVSSDNKDLEALLIKEYPFPKYAKEDNFQIMLAINDMFEYDTYCLQRYNELSEHLQNRLKNIISLYYL